MLEATQKEPEYLSPEEAAPRLGVNAKTIRLNLASGKLRGVKIGRVWRLQWPPQSQQPVKRGVFVEEETPNGR